MKKTTFDVELADAPGRDGLYRVRIRIYQPGEAMGRTTTAIALPKRDWNTKKKYGFWVRTSHPDHASLNSDIEVALKRVREQVESWQSENPAITPRQCTDRFRQLAKLPADQRAAGGAPLLDLMRQAVRSRGTQISPATRQNRLDHIRNFEGYLKTRPEGVQMPQAALTPELIRGFQRHMTASGNKPSSVNNALFAFRAAYHDLLGEQGVAKKARMTVSPFVHVDALTEEKRTIQRLREKDLDALRPDEWVLWEKGAARRGRYPVGPGLIPAVEGWARWCYLACYYQAGMRIGDLIRSRYEWYECDEGGLPVRLAYQMLKNGKWIRIPLSKTAQAHLAVIWRKGASPTEYLLPFLDPQAPYAKARTRQQIRALPEALADQLTNTVRTIASNLNQKLHDIGWKELGLPEDVRLKMHSARHSLADKVRRAMKVDKRIGPTDARDLLGHSTFKTTEGYFDDLDQESLDSAASAVYEV
ncbi:tyrosine-type recombinase/integrase [Rudanella paleaurantiibacter]|uniref:Tyrosine-type recombinase/integrase n=1 Tax=Rudanella paleaurantiibacter TaxID=2614655 RepID=A0A7J5TYT5_9BACT|nr:tyrosine-type recombinase/integrase [Rudanella paleaurantiibacter]KAB7730107.1 tyrosine-type recombinase/integrase [Rudanella paleaurantiibacter]